MLRGRNLRSHLLESKKAACGRWRDPSASKPKKRTGRVLVRRHKNIGAKHALLRCGATDVTRTHDLLITNQLLYRLSYISVWTGGMALLKGHIQNRIHFIIFFYRRQQVLLISCRAPYVAVPVYYILYFEGIPSKCFRAIGPFPTVFPRIPPVATGNSVVIFPRNFDKFCHYFLLTLFFLQSSILFSIYIIYLIISFYKELFTFSTWFSTLEFSIYFQCFSINCINLPSSLFALFHRPKKRPNFT